MWIVCLSPLCVHQARCIKETQRKTRGVHKKKKGFSSPNQRLSQDLGTRFCTFSCPKYLSLDKLKSVLLGWPKYCSSSVKPSTKTSRSFKYLHSTREVLKFWALWQKPTVLVTPLVPRLVYHSDDKAIHVCIVLKNKSKSCYKPPNN